MKNYDVFEGFEITTAGEVSNAIGAFFNFDICGCKIGNYLYTIRKVSEKKIVTIVKHDLQGNIEAGEIIKLDDYREYKATVLKAVIDEARIKYGTENSDPYIDITGNWHMSNGLSSILTNTLPKLCIIG